MSKLNVDQKTIFALFSDKKADFLIPDYQRPYAWEEEQCLTLWEDIYTFAFPDDNYEKFNDNEEYFLGSIVTYKNDNGKSEVIDGQQRLTTLMLLLRAFYDKFASMQDQNSKKTRESIEECIWRTNTFRTADKSTLKIDSEVATDNDKEEFLDLLRTGVVKEDSKSQYVKNYKFFQDKIDEFLKDYASYFPYLPARILKNCILLPIEAESQDTALRIFSTLNDRGLPLSDADIFKAQFYKYYTGKNEKDAFISKWKLLEETSGATIRSSSGNPMDELFSRYMYFLRAKKDNKSSTMEAVRKFYEYNKYKRLKNDDALGDLESLTFFWKSVAEQDEDRFSKAVLKNLYVLNFAPNSMWQNITSVYFLQNRNSEGKLEETKFLRFLKKITAFIFAHSVTNPGVNLLRTPIYEEMINIVKGREVTFENHKFDRNDSKILFDTYQFTNQRASTRSIITWYAYTDENQELLSLDENYQIEHIFAKKRQDMHKSLKDKGNLECLGNKILLEASINISASDYHFEDKKKIYTGEIRRGRNKDKSKISEINLLAKQDCFEENEITSRNSRILDSFFKFLENEGLLA